MEKSYVYLGGQTRIRVKEGQSKISVVNGDVIQSDMPEKHFLSNGFAKVGASSIDEYKVKVKAIESRKQDLVNKEIQEKEIAKINYMKTIKEVVERHEQERSKLEKEENLLLSQRELFENSLSLEIKALESKQKEIKDQIAKMQQKMPTEESLEDLQKQYKEKYGKDPAPAYKKNKERLKEKL